VRPFVSGIDVSGLKILYEQRTKESILDTGRIVAELKRERDRLNRAIAALDGQSPQYAAKTSAVPNRATRSKKKVDRLTPAGRKRLSDMMKKRWAEKRKKGSKA